MTIFTTYNLPIRKHASRDTEEALAMSYSTKFSKDMVLKNEIFSASATNTKHLLISEYRHKVRSG